MLSSQSNSSSSTPRDQATEHARMNEKLFVDLACHKCGNLLVNSRGSLGCPDCNTSLVVDEGIVCCSLRSDSYRHRLPLEIVQKYLAKIKQLGWPKALYELQRSYPKYCSELFANNTASKQAAWRFLLPYTKNRSVLLIGISAESIAIEFAKHSRFVVAVDASKFNLQSLKAAADYHNVDNLLSIYSKEIEVLPLLKGYFDLVVISDMQDCLRQFFVHNPRAISLSFLKAVKAFLHSDGVFYVAGDNRFTYAGLSNNKTKDNSRARKSSTSSHSYRGYISRLREAGMSSKKIYSPLPDHRSVQEMVDLNKSSGSTAIELSSSLKKRFADNPGVLKAFGRSFAVVASRQDTTISSRFDQIISHLSDTLRLDKVEIEDYGIHDTEVVVRVRNSQNALAIRLPYGRQQSKPLLRNVRVLDKIRLLPLEQLLAKSVPQVVYRGTIDSQTVVVERWSEGAFLDSVFSELREESADSALDQLTSRILQLCNQRSRNWLLKGEPDFTKLSVAIRRKILDPNIGRCFETLIQRLMRCLRSVDLPCVVAHGNLTLSKVLYDAETNEVGSLIDWSLGTGHAIAGWDLIALESSVFGKTNDCSLGESIIWLWDNGYAPGFVSLWDKHYSHTKTNEAYRHILLLSYWVRALWADLMQPYKSLDYGYLERNLINVLSRIERI